MGNSQCYYLVVIEGNEHENEPLTYVTDSWFDAMDEITDSLENYRYTRACVLIEVVDGKCINAVRYNKGDNTPTVVF